MNSKQRCGHYSHHNNRKKTVVNSFFHRWCQKTIGWLTIVVAYAYFDDYTFLFLISLAELTSDVLQMRVNMYMYCNSLHVAYSMSAVIAAGIKGFRNWQMDWKVLLSLPAVLAQQLGRAWKMSCWDRREEFRFDHYFPKLTLFTINKTL